jgi:RNA polymerase sigma-70 factor (ECF subfamily)
MTTAAVALEPGRSSRLDFDALLRAHRRELLVHCYRMLGSWTDAEDCVQEVALRAWRGLARFEGRSSARSWLYRIATNACLTARRARARRSLPELEAAPAGPPPPIEEARWIEPMPDDAEAVASSRQEVSLAFLVALQHLAPRQRAALLLRDVVGYETDEVAEILGTTTTAVHSALARARARMHGLESHERRPARPSRRQRGLLKRYVEAWEKGDVKALVALFSRDATVSMPPFAAWYRGRAAIARWLAEQPLSGSHAFRLFPTRANGQVAFAFYKAGGPCLPGETAHEAFAPHCIQLVWLDGDRITRVVSFLSHRLVRAFGFGLRPPRKK